MPTDPAQIPTFNPPSPLKPPEAKTPEAKPPTFSKRPFILFAVFLLLLIIAYLVWYFQYLPQKLETFDAQSPPAASPSLPSPSPPPISILQGIETYTVSQGDKTTPQISKVIINPHDPQLNQSQTIQAQINYDQPVDSVTLKLTSDNDQIETPMKLASGTPTNGLWQTTLTITDTVLYNYIHSITASSNDKSHTTDITIRQL